MDFIHGRLGDGRACRPMSVVDDFNSERLAIEAGSSLPGDRVVRTLNCVIEWRGSPAAIQCDNGTGTLETPSELGPTKGGWLELIQPGNSQQNAYVERYNQTVRFDWLAPSVYLTTLQAQAEATRILWTYNNERPNTALDGITPVKKLAMITPVLLLKPLGNWGITAQWAALLR